MQGHGRQHSSILKLCLFLLCRVQNSVMEDRVCALSLVACTIYFIIRGTLRAGAHTLQELISAGRKTFSGGLFAELLRCAQVLFFIQRAGLINEIFDKDCPPESRMAKLVERLHRGDGIIDLPRPVRVRLVHSCTSKSGGKNEYIGEFIVKHIVRRTTLSPNATSALMARTG